MREEVLLEASCYGLLGVLLVKDSDCLKMTILIMTKRRKMVSL
jgi:hypothetical protein